MSNKSDLYIQFNANQMQCTWKRTAKWIHPSVHPSVCSFICQSQRKTPRHLKINHIFIFLHHPTSSFIILHHPSSSFIILHNPSSSYIILHFATFKLFSLWELFQYCLVFCFDQVLLCKFHGNLSFSSSRLHLSFWSVIGSVEDRSVLMTIHDIYFNTICYFE